MLRYMLYVLLDRKQVVSQVGQVLKDWLGGKVYRMVCRVRKVESGYTLAPVK